jgi:integrase
MTTKKSPETSSDKSDKRRRQKGTGTVYQQKTDGRWIARVTVHDPVTGKTRTVRKGAKSKRAADNLLKEMLTEHHAPVIAKTTRVVDYLTHWRDTTLAVSSRKPATKEQYRNLISSPMTPTLGELKIAGLTPVEVERWLVRLDEYRVKVKNNPAGRPLSQSTKRTCYAVLALACDTAVRDGLLPDNPVRQAPRPAKARVAVPVLSAAEVDALLAAAAKEPRWLPLTVLLANTGLRINEALTLKWADVDLDAARATILDAKTASGKRTVPLVPSVVDALRTQRKWQAECRLKVGPGWQHTGLVFTGEGGAALDDHNCRRAQRRLLKAAGLPRERAFHTLRHSMATRLLGEGVPMPIVSALIGHASIRTTVDTYGHLDTAMSATDLDAVFQAARAREQQRTAD